MRPYQDVRIIDLSFELGSYAARLFANLGAEVIRVEKPGGGSDRDRPPLYANGGSIPFDYLNAGKKSVFVDYETPAGGEILRDLVASAGVVFYERDRNAPDLMPLLVGTPGTQVVTAVSYFGLDGPSAGYLGSDLIAQAAGGIAWLTGRPDKPPLRLAGEQALFVTSLYAAAATAMALWDSEATGRGHVVDVSAQECIAHSLQNATQVWDLEQRISRRGGEGTRDATENIFACQDGYVFLAAPLQLPKIWQALVAWIAESGLPGHDMLAGPEWSDRTRRNSSELHGRFRELFERFTADKTKRQLRDEALARKIILAPVSSFADVLDDPQLVFRDFFRTTQSTLLEREVLFPGAPYLTSEPIWAIDRAAPAAGDTALSDLVEPAGSAGKRATA